MDRIGLDMRPKLATHRKPIYVLPIGGDVRTRCAKGQRKEKEATLAVASPDGSDWVGHTPETGNPPKADIIFINGFYVRQRCAKG